MAEVSPIEIYNLVVGIAASVGLLYLVYAQHFVIGYRRFLSFIIAGFLVFSIGGPIIDLVAPEWAHAVHGTAALLVIFGLYDPVRNDLRKTEWAELVFSDPAVVRNPAEWMTPMDDEMLELFHSTELVLSPSIIAYNLDYSREAVSRRLGELCEHGFAEKIELGKYRLTGLGEQYLKLYPVSMSENGGSVSRAP